MWWYLLLQLGILIIPKLVETKSCNVIFGIWAQKYCNFHNCSQSLIIPKLVGMGGDGGIIVPYFGGGKH
jgi:hypothetical protein